MANVVARPAGSTAVFSMPGRGYYNPRHDWEAKAFGTYGVARYAANSDACSRVRV